MSHFTSSSRDHSTASCKGAIAAGYEVNWSDSCSRSPYTFEKSRACQPSVHISKVTPRVTFIGARHSCKYQARLRCNMSNSNSNNTRPTPGVAPIQAANQTMRFPVL